MKRTLCLRREALAELTGPELESVAGGTKPSESCIDDCFSAYRCPVPTIRVRDCLP